MKRDAPDRARRQHTSPCAACPFRRSALPGWLGGLTPEEFLQMAQSETRMPCHLHCPDGINYAEPGPAERSAAQCAGRAVYWANQIKMRRDPNLLELPPDRTSVFTWPQEFLEHHRRNPIEWHASRVAQKSSEEVTKPTTNTRQRK